MSGYTTGGMAGPSDERLAEIAYNAYRAETGGVSVVTGDSLPEWADLRPEIREAWQAAVRAVRVEVG